MKFASLTLATRGGDNMRKFLALPLIALAFAAPAAASTRPAPIPVTPTPIQLDPACVAFAVAHHLPITPCVIPPNPNA